MTPADGFSDWGPVKYFQSWCVESLFFYILYEIEKSYSMGGMWVTDLKDRGLCEGIERGSELASDGREWNLSMIELGERRQEPPGCQSEAVCVCIHGTLAMLPC